MTKYSRPLESPEDYRMRRLIEDMKINAWYGPTKSQEELDAISKEKRRKKAEERKARSQARRDELQAQIDRDGGAYYTALFDGDRRLDARVVDGKFGPVWMMSVQEEKDYKRMFVPSGKNSSIQRKLGLHEERSLFRAKVVPIAKCDGFWMIVIDEEMK